MSFRRSLVILVVGMGLLPSACLFTDPINRAPNARIVVQSSGPYYLDSWIEVSAAKSSDPDGDDLEVYWRAWHCDDDGCGEPFRREEGEINRSWVVEPRQKGGTLHVVLSVADPYGAVSGDELIFDILNRPPEVELQVQGDFKQAGSYLVGREVVAVAEARDPDDDDDAVELHWHLGPPSDSDPNEVVWEPIDDTRWRLLPDVPGNWTIEVEARDGDGGVDTTSQVVAVGENTPPCIAVTEPPAPGGGGYVLGVEDAPRRFSVLAVDDELDPYPARAGDPDGGEASFRWLLAKPASGGEFFELSGRDAPDLVVDPGEHAPGDLLALRVEVSDREERDIACGPKRLTCSIRGDDCIQRTTWEVEIR